MMEPLDKSTVMKNAHSVRILQFGEGNFLRAFFDWMIETANRQGVTDASIVVVSPRFKANDTIKALQEQDGMYHVCLEGIENGKPKQTTTLVTAIADAFSPIQDPDKYIGYITSPELRFVVSNTTEAGIVYNPSSPVSLYDATSTFPAKITAMLYERFRHFNGDPFKGLVFLCCELIEDNGSLLKEYVLRHSREARLGEEFEKWVDESCHFCDTLVDRIVSGFPADSIEEIKGEIGYNDNLVVKGELYHVWAIGGEGAEIVKRELPLDKAGLNVHFLPSVKEFRDKKVRILNGSHTGMVPVALQLGCETVLNAFRNDKVNTFVNRMVETEVLPMIEGDREELQQFADGILERFYNPYIRHMLKSIALNSLSKWETRNFPTVRDMWEREGRLAELELFTFAAMLTLYEPDSGFEPQDNA
ncbi:MAG: tagaturonate reductase, partial [Muribaculaceae bacterium]|nr:tagaturonate reductase [Muribaculaceae bacterium]